jgi:hypothetical protein
MEQAVAAANAKSDSYKSRVDALINDVLQIRIERVGAIKEAETVRCYPWGSSNNSTFVAAAENSGGQKEVYFRSLVRAQENARGTHVGEPYH